MYMFLDRGEAKDKRRLARFLNGLNREIQDVVKMHHYETLKDLIHQATKVEQ